MPNHFRLICSFSGGSDRGLVLKNIKSFTAIRLIDAVIKNPQESRKEWLLPLFEKHCTQNKSNYSYHFRQQENHTVLLANAALFAQRLKYLHENPVRAGFVTEPEHWKYSSALDYIVIKGKGMLVLVLLE